MITDKLIEVFGKISDSTSTSQGHLWASAGSAADQGLKKTRASIFFGSM
jgi:hypothetical protein